MTTSVHWRDGYDEISHYESALIYLVFQVRKSSRFVGDREAIVNFLTWRRMLSPCAEMGSMPSCTWDPLVILAPMPVLRCAV